jgi:hypothetical protein
MNTRIASIASSVVAALAFSASSPAVAQTTCGESWQVVHVGSPGSQAICYDELHRETVTVSGGAIWSWNGMDWIQEWADSTLDGAHAMAYDRNRGVCYIFGGANRDDKLWKWDGSALTLIANDTIGNRTDVGMAFDWKRDRLVIHGGFNGSSLLSDWAEWDPATNTWQTFNGGPIGPLYAHRMVYDPVREVCVLHGGFYFFNRNVTGLWNGTTWTQATTSGPARYVFCMEWDSTRQQVVLHSGTTCCGETEYPTTWTWRGGDWVQCSLQGPPRGYTNMAFDVHRDRFVMPGGIGPTPSGRQWIPETNELVMGCTADINGDGRVDGTDLGNMMVTWGTAAPGTPADLNADGVVNSADLGALLGAWGACPG